MTTTIELDEATAERIDALATQTGQDRKTILRMLIDNGIEDVAAYFRAAATLERVRRGEEKTFTDAEVRAELGLDD